MYEIWKATILAWDGEPPDQSGFAALVPLFLREQPQRKAVAFTRREDVEDFQAKWRDVSAEFKDRIVVVAVDVEAHQSEPGMASALPVVDQSRFILRRVALRSTGSKRVIALGGCGIAAAEAAASVADVKWTVYSLGRGSKESVPSLMDWAHRSASPNVQFIYWKDPEHHLGFAGEAPEAVPLDVLDLEGFKKWKAGVAGDIAHIKGFSNGMAGTYNQEAVEQLKAFSVVAWDGDPLSAGSFTALVEPFLQADPGRKAVAFKKKDSVEKLQASWQEIAAKFTGRIVVVAVDPKTDFATLPDLQAERGRVSAFPNWSQEFYLLGRVAIKATGSKFVVSLGGGGIAGLEAEASFDDGVQWVVYAQSRLGNV